MKEVAILLLLALMLTGCGSTNNNTAQNTASGSWQAQLSGGAGVASGFSFITAFTVAGNGALGITYLQFINTAPCFATIGSDSGTLIVTTNSSNVVTGTLSFTVTSSVPAGNKLTLTGTESANTITGTWQASGNSDCTAAGTFTMAQS